MSLPGRGRNGKPTDARPSRIPTRSNARRSLFCSSLLEQLVADGRALARAGLRGRHPQADAREIELRLAALLYGKQAAALLGPVPDDAVEPLGAVAP